MAVTVRELITKLTVRGDAGSKLAKFGLAVNGLKAGLGILTGALKIVTRATFGFVNQVATQNDLMAKTARTLALTSAEYQRLSFAADRSGISLKTLEKSVITLSKGMAESGTTSGKRFDEALSRLGLTMKDLAGLNTEERIGRIGEALNNVTDETQRVNIAQKIFGERAGPRLANLLREGEAGVKALGDEAERLGFILGEEALKQSEEFVDAMTNLNAVITGVKRSIAVELIPGVQKGVKQFQKWIIANRDFIKQKMVKVIDGLSKAFVFLLARADKIAERFEEFVDVVVAIVSAISSMVEAVGGLKNALKIATVAFVAFKVAAAFALGPIGLAVTAVGLLAVAFFKVETAADRARIAQDKFNKSANEDVKLNREQAKRDAVQAAIRLRRGGDISRVLRRQLVTGSRAQVELVIRETRKLLRPSSVRGKSGTGVATTGQKAALRALRAVEADLADQRAVEQRSRDRDARRLESQGDVLDPTKGLISEVGFDVGRTFTPTGVTEGKKGKKEKKEKESLDDLLANAIKSGKLPEEAALLASTQPPIIIPITNNIFSIEVDAPVTVTGVPGEDAEDFSERVIDIFDEQLVGKLRNALDEVRPRLAR